MKLCLHRFQLGPIVGLALVVFLAATPASVGDPPVLQIARKQYTFKDLYGADANEMHKEFEKDAKEMSADQLKEVLRWEGHEGNQLYQKLENETDRDILREALSKAHLASLLEQAARRLIPSYVIDAMIEQHGTSLKEYFDTKTLRDALLRNSKYWEFMKAHRDIPRDKDEEVYRAAPKDLRVQKLSKKQWATKRTLFNKMWPFQYRYFELGRYCLETGQDLHVLILPHIFQEAIAPKGVFYELARAYHDFAHSTVVEFELRGFSGETKVLEDFFGQVVGADGDIAVAGVGELKKWLKKFSPTTELKVSYGLGITFLSGYEVPESGRLYHIGPKAYRMVVAKAPAKKKDATDKNPRHLFYRTDACMIAASRFVPEVKSFLKGVKLKPEVYLRDAIASSAQQKVPEVELDSFIRKPYPNRFFEEMEQHRKPLDEMVLTAARLSIQFDKKGAQQLVAQARQKEQQAETPVVKRAYRRIGEKLTADMKLDTK